MNPVFRRYNVKNPFFIIPILCIPNLLRIMAWILRFARNDASGLGLGGRGRRATSLWEHRFQPVGPPDLSGGKGGVFSSLCRMNSAPTTG